MNKATPSLINRLRLRQRANAGDAAASAALAAHHSAAWFAFIGADLAATFPTIIGAATWGREHGVTDAAQ